MTWIWWLVLGLLLGWLIEWLIDWFYWRPRLIDRYSIERRELQSKLTLRQKELDALRVELRAELARNKQAAVPAPAPIADRIVELGALRERIEELQGRSERLATTLVAERTTPAIEYPDGADPLIAIEGIGPLYQQRLFDGGIRTYADLAAADPQRLRSMAEPNDLDVDVGPWIDAARRLQLPDRTDPLIDINGIGPVYEHKLNEAGIKTFDQLAALTPERVLEIIKPERWQELKIDEWIAEARAFAEQVRSGTYRKE